MDLKKPKKTSEWKINFMRQEGEKRVLSSCKTWRKCAAISKSDVLKYKPWQFFFTLMKRVLTLMKEGITFFNLTRLSGALLSL